MCDFFYIQYKNLQSITKTLLNYSKILLHERYFGEQYYKSARGHYTKHKYMEKHTKRPCYTPDTSKQSDSTMSSPRTFRDQNMCNCMVDSDFGTGDFLLVMGILHVCGHVHVRSHESPGMDWGMTVVINVQT